MGKSEKIVMIACSFVCTVFLGVFLYMIYIDLNSTYEYGSKHRVEELRTLRYQATTVDGTSIDISKKDGAFLVDAIDEETHSLMVPVSVKGTLIGKIQIDEPTDTGGVMKTVVRGDVYAYKNTVIYVADYAFDNSYDYAVLKGKDATRVKKIING